MDLVFDIPEPSPADLKKILSIWGTYYYVHKATHDAGGVPLKDKSGKDLGPRLTAKDWCLAGVEGTVSVSGLGADVQTYNYAGKTGAKQTSCGAYVSLSPSLVAALEKTRWAKAKGPYGDGAAGKRLVPYRSLAVDLSVFDIGDVFYLPEARGCTIELPDGKSAVHDGFFIASDTGGAIKARHCDFFLGPTKRNPFPFVKSSSSGKIEAFLVLDGAVVAKLGALHSP